MRANRWIWAVVLTAACTASDGVDRNEGSEGIAASQPVRADQFQRGFPLEGTAQQANDASDLRRAIEAYKFFFPTMGSEAVMQQMLSNGAAINEIGHVMATWPRIQFGAANSDTPYALATLDLMSSGPMVVELPPGPFIGFVDDHNMRWVQDMGIIGPDAARVLTTHRRGRRRSSQIAPTAPRDSTPGHL